MKLFIPKRRAVFNKTEEIVHLEINDLGFSKTTLGYSKFNDGKLKEFKFRKNI